MHTCISIYIDLPGGHKKTHAWKMDHFARHACKKNRLFHVASLHRYLFGCLRFGLGSIKNQLKHQSEAMWDLYDRSLYPLLTSFQHLLVVNART